MTYRLKSKASVGPRCIRALALITTAGLWADISGFYVTGRLINSSCEPVAEAQVRVVGGDSVAYTNSLGFFRVGIADNSAARATQPAGRSWSAKQVGSALVFNGCGGRTFSILSFALDGTLLGTLQHKPGAYNSIVVPLASLGGGASGTIMVRASSDSETRVLRCVNPSGTNGGFLSPAADGRSATPASPLAKSMADDTVRLQVSAPGYPDTTVERMVYWGSTYDNLHVMMLLDSAERETYAQILLEWREWDDDTVVVATFGDTLVHLPYFREPDLVRLIDTAWLYGVGGALVDRKYSGMPRYDTTAMHWNPDSANMRAAVLVIQRTARAGGGTDTVPLAELTALRYDTRHTIHRDGALYQYEVTWPTGGIPPSEMHHMGIVLDNGLFAAEYLYSAPNFNGESEIFGFEAYTRFFSQFCPAGGEALFHSWQDRWPYVNATITVLQSPHLTLRFRTSRIPAYRID